MTPPSFVLEGNKASKSGQSLQPRFKYLLHDSLAVEPCGRYLTSLYPSFLICKIANHGILELSEDYVS